MAKKRARLTRWCILISLLLVTCGPVVAQYSDRLGGNWNNPASATITNIVMDRLARHRLEKRLGAKHSEIGTTTAAHDTTAPANDATVRFRSTGTQLKTREIANLFAAPPDPNNETVFTLLKTLLRSEEHTSELQ